MNARTVGEESTVSVVLVDDHEIVRRGLRQMLEVDAGLDVVGEAGSVAAGLSLIGAVVPAVAVIDLELPDGSGVDLCREVKQRWSEVGCLVLTSHDDDAAVFDAISAGADAYLLKQVASLDLVGAVRTVSAGGSLLDPAITGRVLDRVRNGPPEDPLLSQLTERELTIVRHVGDGLTNRDIAQRLHLAEKTVKNNLSVVLAKMGMSRRTELAAYISRTDVRRQGPLSG